ncbi:hypothetical protein CLV59_101869 [Chitinophaga dinghuensis]|uniref:Membrane protein DUF2157 n=1 Tax=Chitinophaga dinghuensis TaxID=1539050 RepID=A0A327WJY0_9BACT|nr:hypothetical protein [Chitinophaga dinghuensis]RAJ88104.1 hypothetical protein CLV59_101869 [Chitinophaga dinghuensis]
MLAYNKTQLDNQEIIAATEKAYKQGYISAEERNNITEAHPVELYSPNVFMRVGIFVLTMIIAIFSMGLFGLMLLSGNASEGTFRGLLFFCGIISYAAAELLIKGKHHYKSGADDALIYFSAICIFYGVLLGTHYENEIRTSALVITIISVYISLRFADMIATAAAFGGLMWLLYSFIPNPWVIMIVSLGSYLLAVRLKYKYYASNALVLQSLALLTLYAAGNYFVVRELTGRTLSIFWVSTVLIPLIYLFLGVYKKDRTLLRIGLLLIAAMVFTIRYYHSIAPLEVAMTFAGAGMIAIAYVLLRYLKTPRHGFTSEEDDEEQTGALQLESLIIAQTFHKSAESDHVNFGGGTGGGGGASGDY